MDNKIQIDHKYDLLISQLQTMHIHSNDMQGYLFEAGDTLLLFDAFIKNIARFLAKNKCKDKRVAVVINDWSNNFVMGVAIDYEKAENEEDEMPGNWELVASFDSDKILGLPNELVYNLQNSMLIDSLQALVYNHNKLRILDKNYLPRMLIMYYSALAEAIKQGANNDTGKPYTLELGDMVATGQLEDGKVVTAIELQGTVKAIAKDDTSLESLNK